MNPETIPVVALVKQPSPKSITPAAVEMIA
jgi:hypothetical protein